MTISFMLGNKELGSNRVIECCRISEGEYRLRYRCNKCGEVGGSTLRYNKIAILRCKCCNTRGYIIPIVSDGKIIWYRFMSEAEYRKAKSKFSELDEKESFIDYVNKNI